MFFERPHIVATFYNTQWKSIFFSIGILLCTIVGHAQYVRTDGVVKDHDTKRKFAGVKVALLRNGAAYKTATTNARGEYAFDLEFNQSYTLIYSKPGYVSKRLSINTKGVPPEEQQIGGFKIPVQMTLFKEIEGLKIDVLKQPIGKYKYNPNENDILHDDAYTRGIQDAVNALMADYEKKKREQEARLKEFNALVKKGDGEYNGKNYESAVKTFEKALTLFPKDEAAIEKHRQAKQKWDAMRNGQELEARYRGFITAADNMFDQKNYKGSIEIYNKALGVKPGEAYPTKRIAEAQRLIDAAKLQQDKDQQDAAYKDWIAKADQAFDGQQYQKAIDLYNKALEIKIEPYPRQRINEAERLIAGAKIKQDKDAVDREYNTYISKANGLFDNKKYADARKQYQNALGIKQGQRYPTDRIAECDRLLALAKIQDGTKATDTQYKQLITEANALFGEKQYQQARKKYEEASGVKPDERHPKIRMAEIDRLLASTKVDKGQEVLDKKYNGYVTKADGFFKQGDYGNAKVLYKKALGLKPGSSYPTNQIAEANRLIALNRMKKDDTKTVVKTTKGVPEYQQIVDRTPSRADKYQQILDQKNQHHSNKASLANNASQKRNEASTTIKDQYKQTTPPNPNRVNHEQYAVKDRTLSTDEKYKRVMETKANITNGNSERIHQASQQRTATKASLNETDMALKEYNRQRINPEKYAVENRTLSVNERYAQLAQFKANYNKNLDRLSNNSEANREAAKEGLKKYDNSFAFNKADYGVSITEEKYSENNKTIIKRTVVQGPKVDEYSKIIARWGTMYFKNGHSITEHAWVTNTGGE